MIELTKNVPGLNRPLLKLLFYTSAAENSATLNQKIDVGLKQPWSGHPLVGVFVIICVYLCLTETP